MPTNARELEELRWKKFPVLDDGFVCLVDVMGDDQSVVQAARVSYGEGTKQVSDDRGLIRYLLRHRHTTPFEMAEIKLLVRVPMDSWRQWIRHRTANVNEYSTRYSLAIDAAQRTPPDEWRTQAAQQSPGQRRSAAARARPAAHGRRGGVPGSGPRAVRAAHRARRGARAGPQGPAAVDLHRGVLEDRPAQPAALPGAADGRARPVGNPRSTPRPSASRSCSRCSRIVWEAFVDYRLQAMHLTRLDCELIQRLMQRLAATKASSANEEDFLAVQDPTWADMNRCRERDECREKLIALGILTPDP